MSKLRRASKYLSKRKPVERKRAAEFIKSWRGQHGHEAARAGLRK